MMRFFQSTVFLLTAAGLLLAGCGNDAPETPAEAQRTYGAPVEVPGAIPAPAVAAEQERYLGHRVTVDGRIAAVTNEGCTLLLDAAGNGPIQIIAPRTADSCAWQVPTELNGIAVAAGTLRIAGDTLRLSANGVQVTPVQIAEPDS